VRPRAPTDAVRDAALEPEEVFGSERDVDRRIVFAAAICRCSSD